MEIGTIVAVLSFAMAILGSVFKLWIINPLSVAIQALGDNIKEMKLLVNSMKQTQEDVRRQMAVLENDFENLTKRVDKMEEQLGHIMLGSEHK